MSLMTEEAAATADPLVAGDCTFLNAFVTAFLLVLLHHYLGIKHINFGADKACVSRLCVPCPQVCV